MSEKDKERYWDEFHNERLDKEEANRRGESLEEYRRKRAEREAELWHKQYGNGRRDK